MFFNKPKDLFRCYIIDLNTSSSRCFKPIILKFSNLSCYCLILGVRWYKNKKIVKYIISND